MATRLATLDLVRALTNAVDDLHDLVLRLSSLSETHGKRLQLFQGQDAIRQDTIQSILEELPPKRASALMVALMDLSKFAPTDQQDADRMAAKVESDFKLLRRIRANLHTALGDDEA